MPYRHGHYYVGFVLLVIMVGFWASYWSPIANVPTAFHVHAISSSSWLLLLIVQSVAIHRRANAFHKQMGRASFVLFPFLIFGFMMIIDVSAQRYAAQESPFIMHNGPAFGIGMVIAVAAYLTLFYQALKHRRNVKLHAGYMLATPLILFESPFSRVIVDYLPWLNVIGSSKLHAVQDTIVISNVMAIIFAMTLFFIDRRHGAPWLVASCFMGFQAIAMWNAPGIAWLGDLFAAYARIPQVTTFGAGILAGIAAGWLGWKAGLPPPRQARPATTPA